MLWAKIVGTVLQLAGLLMAAYGVSETRQTYAPDRPGVAGTIRGWGLGGSNSLRRLLGRPATPFTLQVHDADQVQASETVLLEVYETPLAGDLLAEEQLRVLDERTRAHREQLNLLAARLFREQRERESAMKRIDAAVSGEAAGRRQELAHAMAGGLSRESVGLSLAAVGTLLAAFG